eukprot:15434441-Alexandrium_andersonii.AAC.1
MQPARLAAPVPGPMTPTATPASSSAPSAASLTTGQDERVTKLEADVAQLREAIAQSHTEQREAAQQLAAEVTTQGQVIKKNAED